MFGFQRFGLSDRVERWVSHDGGTVTFSGITNSGKSFSIVTYLDEANRWANGGLIQECFPHLTAEEREILMTGNDDEAWDAMFPPESISTVVEDEE